MREPGDCQVEDKWPKAETGCLGVVTILVNFEALAALRRQKGSGRGGDGTLDNTGSCGMSNGNVD
jgi:hypothetical protein